MMTKFLTAGVMVLACAATAWADGPADGIYSWSEGPGVRVRRNDGAEVVLGRRLGEAFGPATIRAVRNDNGRFRLQLDNAGPIGKAPDGAGLAVVIDGVVLGVWSQSDRHPDGTLSLACAIHGEAAARRIAKVLKTEPKLRTHPGHHFTTSWAPTAGSFAIGSPVALKLEIRNTGDVPFTFMVGGQQRGPRDNQYRFLAYSGSGTGKAVPDTGDPINFGGIGSIRTLRPGESFTAVVALDKWFRFDRPDTYRVTGLFQMALSDATTNQTIWDDFAVGDCAVRVDARK